MARLNLVDPSQAEGELKDLLSAVKSKMGRIVNLVKVMSNSPAVLEAYLGPKLAEQLALAVS